MTASVSVDGSMTPDYQIRHMRDSVSMGALLALVIASGCGSPARVIPADKLFRESPSLRDPTVFLDRKPTQVYRLVGVIEVLLDADASLDTIKAAVVPKGRQVGCSVLVEWGIHQRVSAAPRTPDGHLMTLVHEGEVERSPQVERAPPKPQRTYRFACGVPAGTAPVTTNPA